MGFGVHRPGRRYSPQASAIISCRRRMGRGRPRFLRQRSLLWYAGLAQSATGWRPSEPRLEGTPLYGGARPPKEGGGDDGGSGPHPQYAWGVPGERVQLLHTTVRDGKNIAPMADVSYLRENLYWNMLPAIANSASATHHTTTRSRLGNMRTHIINLYFSENSTEERGFADG